MWLLFCNNEDPSPHLKFFAFFALSTPFCFFFHIFFPQFVPSLGISWCLAFLYTRGGGRGKEGERDLISDSNTLRVEKSSFLWPHSTCQREQRLVFHSHRHINMPLKQRSKFTLSSKLKAKQRLRMIISRLYKRNNKHPTLNSNLISNKTIKNIQNI